MTLSLDHRQRLNLIAVLGAYDIRGRDLHALWHLQDLLDLDESEKRSIDFRQETVNGNVVQVWNLSKEFPARSFDLSESDLKRIRQAIEDFPQFRGSRDRAWLEPLLAQIPKSVESNGDKL